MLLLSLLAAAAASLVAATSSPAAISTTNPAKLVVSNSGALHVVTFDGADFTEDATFNMTGLVPSFFAFNPPNMLYTYDENSNITFALSIDLETNVITQQETAQGCLSPVHMLINADGTRLLAACFAGGDVSIWDISTGGLKLLTNVHTAGDPLGPGQIMSRAHESVMDPTGRFFAINNLGDDAVVIIDGKDDRWEVVNRQTVQPAGCGPRHGSFFPTTGQLATHYMVVCENHNLVHVFSVKYLDNTLLLTPTQTMSTFAQNTTANITNARAAELLISDDGDDVYVTNRLLSADPTDADQDSIAHFRLEKSAVHTSYSSSPDGSDNSTASAEIDLQIVREVLSGGLVPRMASLSRDNSFLFVGNQVRGPAGLAAFSRDAATGALSVAPVASLDFSVFGTESGFGPQCVVQIA